MKAYNILLIEDDEIDIINIERAFKKANILNPLYKAKDGVEGLEILNRKEISKPLLIILDLNMPKMNGIEFLKAIRQSPELHIYPVVVLTTSKRDEDILDAYKNHVAGYLIKPVSVEQFVETMASLGNYWSLCEM